MCSAALRRFQILLMLAIVEITLLIVYISINVNMTVQYFSPEVSCLSEAYTGGTKEFIHRKLPKLDLIFDAEYVANLANVKVNV